eukprot:TRINITY_DN5106_c0_g1_i1.p1 TRINITY_DN5106_c0_g1~~TRINITY_DN5106_c0_g1_i1.p1  ORF type:complete len:404 (-),score=70.56 TRINITY_DN5106_c0_g1_i1:794-2005(-)
MSIQYKIANIELAKNGKEEIKFAELDLCGLAGLRKEYISKKPLLGIFVVGCSKITRHTAVLIETLVLLGAKVRWAASGRNVTSDHVAAAIASAGIPIFAWREMHKHQYWWAIEQAALKDPDFNLNYVIDESGDLIFYLQREHPSVAKNILGAILLSEKAISTVTRFIEKRLINYPIISLHHSSLLLELKAIATWDTLSFVLRNSFMYSLTNKNVIIVGYNYMGSLLAKRFRNSGCLVDIVDTDPILVFRARMDGFKTHFSLVTPISSTILLFTRVMDELKSSYLFTLPDGCVLINLTSVELTNFLSFTQQNKYKKTNNMIITRNHGQRLVFLAMSGTDFLSMDPNGPSNLLMSYLYTNTILALSDVHENSKIPVTQARYKPNKVYQLAIELERQSCYYHSKDQ